MQKLFDKNPTFKIITAILIGVVLSLSSFLIFSKEGQIWQYLLVPSSLLATLSGQAMQTDIAQDFYGFQALVGGLDPYPPLGVVYDSIGIDWNLTQPSTHPPTAFLLTAPVAWLPWRLSSALWAWLMLGSVIWSFRLYGLGWRQALQLSAIGLLWPPLTASLGQLTPLWLLGIALAFHWRVKSPFASGFWIGFAALTKFLPGIFLLLFLVRKKWAALIGFTTAWGAALIFLVWLAPGSIRRYLEVSRAETMTTITRPDNTALVAATLVRCGPILAAGVLLFLLLLLVRNGNGWFVQTEISQVDWELFSFLAVALLPISWIYSLLPLMPDLFRRTMNPGGASWLAAAAIGVVAGMPLYGTTTYYYTSCFFVLYGLTFFFVKNEVGETNLTVRDPEKLRTV